MIENQTPADAYLRISIAKTGCMIRATDVYLERLIQELEKWTASMRGELLKRIEAKQEEAAEVACIHCNGQGIQDDEQDCGMCQGTGAR